MKNVQQRRIDASADRVGQLLDRVVTSEDSVWPSPAWPPLLLDAGLLPGSRGGHGPVRYRVDRYEPGCLLRFRFEPELGLDGHHEFQITPQGPQACLITHTIVAAPRGRMLLLWPLVIRWLHEALIQDLFDQVERAATGQLKAAPARWSTWVRVLRRSERALTSL